MTLNGGFNKPFLLHELENKGLCVMQPVLPMWHALLVLNQWLVNPTPKPGLLNLIAWDINLST